MDKAVNIHIIVERVDGDIEQQRQDVHSTIGRYYTTENMYPIYYYY